MFVHLNISIRLNALEQQWLQWLGATAGLLQRNPVVQRKAQMLTLKKMYAAIDH